jgi:hypothetical protein
VRDIARISTLAVFGVVAILLVGSAQSAISS